MRERDGYWVRIDWDKWGVPCADGSGLGATRRSVLPVTPLAVLGYDTSGGGWALPGAADGVESRGWL